MAVQTLIQVRRGTTTEWSSVNPVLNAGEWGLDTTTKRYKLGDGLTAWNSLPYASIMPNSNDLVGTSGVGINFSSTTGIPVTLSITGITSSQVNDFASSVSGLLPVKSILAGNNITVTATGDNGFVISSPVNENTVKDIIGSSVTGVSGVSVAYDNSSKITTISLSDTTIQLADITDLSSDARSFLLTPSSSNLASLIGDETGSGALVFANNPTMSGVTIHGNLTVGGSGLVASNINDFDSQVRTSRLDQMAVPTSDVSFNSVKITNLATPTSDNDAANKAYVDAVKQGLDVKNSVRVATIADITLSGTQTIDGVSLVVGDRVLVKNQSIGSENGIYVVSSGAWNRSNDADVSSEVTAGMFTFVSEGNTNADSGWVLITNDAIILGTTSLSFAQFSGAGQITAGNGLTKTGNTIDVVGTSGRIVVNADSIDLDTVSQSDSTGSDGTSFVQSVSRDSYGRVTGVITSTVQNASTSAKGIASFNSGNFSVNSGTVSIKASGIDNSQLANNSVTIGSTPLSLGDTITSVSGLVSVSSTTFIGDLSGTATNALNIEVDVASSGTNNLVFVNSTDGNLKPSVNNNLRFNASTNELLGSSNTTPATVLKHFIIDGGTP